MKRLSGFILLVGISSMLHADIHTDLIQLDTEVQGHQSTLANFSFLGNNSCSDLAAFNRGLKNTIGLIESITGNLSTVTLTTADTDALNSLSNTLKAMAGESFRIGFELNSVNDVADLFEYRAGISAMLQLSTDIGTMADRILEMADRILIMADNIGAMADRIIETQRIQNANIALTQSTMLRTQENMVLLSDSLSSILYNLTLAQIKTDSDLLKFEMENTTLDNENMAVKLAYFQTRTTLILGQMNLLLSGVVASSGGASHYINSDTLTLLGDLSQIHAALGSAIQTFSQGIEQLAPLTSTPVLSDATKAMLQLAADIQSMSDRIMVMTDKITIMADNIGLMSNRIVQTQNLQMTNVTLTQSSILTSQNIMITMISNFGL